MWRLRRVSDDKFLLHGSHRKSSVRAPGAPTPPEAARDVDVIKEDVVEGFVVNSDDDKGQCFLGGKEI